ncbi:OmpA family protein [Chryseobacterium oryctis]|uniref:OmpA family protein n=1 Tax=Chryseobacterium oryctis TaxID=2952618 RepID=A0ABT3HQ01_9FLAO|nr:OmpA family protein [Chryseobacterium oryctis]MCW3161861.1 OmpA family protein [Chryseobacterium oryctis]
MRKLIICLAIATIAVSCKKVPDGGNKNIIKLEEGADRYSEDVQGGGEAHGHGVAAHTEKTQVSIDLNGTALKGFANGLEESMIKYLKSGQYATDTEDGLKNTWYNFDNVNFKTGSSNQLEAGSQEQLNNLAKILKAYPDAKIKIGGYTDKTGDEAKNLKLSQDRANFIKAELSKLGVEGQIVSAEGYGSQYAKVDAKASDAERASDRKMSVRFTK